MATNIEYLDATWSPVTGCSHAGGPGCDFCWAKAMVKRFGETWGYDFTPQLHEDRLKIPLKWKKPRRIGVSFMGDLFHELISIFTNHDIFDVMAKCPQHTFVLLTKRPQRMKDAILSWAHPIPSNWWLGVSAENQEQADKRIPILLQIPAAGRFVSVEPMLGPVDLSYYFADFESQGDEVGASQYENAINNTGLNWVIVGGENGHGARHCKPAWVLNIRDQCIKAGVRFFFKGFGTVAERAGARTPKDASWQQLPWGKV